MRFFILALIFIGCSKDNSEPSPQNPKNLTQRSQDIVSRKCVPCHSGQTNAPKLLTIDKFRVRGAYWEIKETRMPKKPETLTGDERKDLLEYFGDVE